MMWLSLLVSIVYIPGYLGVSIPTQWAMLSCVLPLALWRSGPWTLLHWLGAGFLAYAFGSLLWTENRYDAVGALWTLSIVALSFWLGSALPDLRKVFLGLTFGLYLSVALAAFQAMGYHPVLDEGVPSGLFFSRVIFGQVLALTVVGLLCIREARLISPLLLGIALSGSRGAIVTALVGLFAWAFPRPLWLLCGALLGAFAFTLSASPSDIQRIQLWSGAASGLTLFGLGAGSWSGIAEPGKLIFGNVHNDYLQLVYEFGLGAAPILAIYALCLTRTDTVEWPLFVAFAVSALFSFPLYSPIPAALGALAAGRMSRDWSVAWGEFLNRRFGILSRRTYG